MPRDNKIPVIPTAVSHHTLKELFTLVADFISEGRKVADREFSFEWALCIVDSVKVPGIALGLHLFDGRLILKVYHRPEDYREPLENIPNHKLPPEILSVKQLFMSKYNATTQHIEHIDSNFLEDVLNAV